MSECVSLAFLCSSVLLNSLKQEDLLQFIDYHNSSITRHAIAHSADWRGGFVPGHNARVSI